MKRTLIAALVVLGVSGCDQSDDPGNRRPKVAVSVLVDLSETWHNPIADDLNKRVLTAVGNAIAGAANRLPRPIAVRFHAIGEASLGREPICATAYRPSAFSVGKVDPGTIRDREQFTRYVAADCPSMMLARPIANSTEIGAAIISADRALQLTKKGVPKVFVILSDFKEESPVPYSFRGLDFRDSRFVLVYRTLTEDRLDPGFQKAKLRAWESRLENLGAEVEVLDENAVLSSPKDFEALLRTSTL
nr:hypothetical protein [uncultured Sphingomonas sp.]